ncbi:MAG TPA: carbon-nitrogen hydrolase family protein [Flavitalea sp.]|nr:carbon-nitrogen hydrolase family protein [Flavitalea sp.]
MLKLIVSSILCLSFWYQQKQSVNKNVSHQAQQTVKVAAIALATVDGMMDANYQRALRLTEIAAQEHPDIILLPEAFAAGYAANDLTPFGETLESSKYLNEFRQRSSKYGCMIIVGYLQKISAGLHNSAVIFDRGKVVGSHNKSTLWPDKKRAYRDEQHLIVPGKGMEVIQTRFGKVGLLICYENMIGKNWDLLKGKVDLVISPYNCEDDPSRHNIAGSKKINVPSVWADRVGTVYCGNDNYTSNPGTAGIVDQNGKVLYKSRIGEEKIIVGNIVVKQR